MSGGLVTLSGCSQLASLTQECDDMHSTTIDVKEVTLTDEQLSHLFPILFNEIPEEQQGIIESASEEGRYKACPPESEGLDSLIDLSEERINRQWEEYGGEPKDRPDYLRTAYLKREGSLFAIEITVEDMVISG
ncbi:hypothetical protein [Halorussus halophilus]|uniref:hypothetical protein n=1 Tax=Halorussus halophilus TaxID=2650975 RepID=UPI00130110B6|nr:hypothetical protein [Halorussus halophilus]